MKMESVRLLALFPSTVKKSYAVYSVSWELATNLIQYIGNQAKHQLVKNSKNTIVGFRNLLGKK